MRYVVQHEGQQFEVDVVGSSPEYLVTIQECEYVVHASTLGDESLLSLLVQNRSCLAHVLRTQESTGMFDVSIKGKHASIQVLDELSSMAQSMNATPEDNGFVLRAPMPGLIVDIRVAKGDRVDIGTSLVVMEAMKMQNELLSESRGIIAEVLVQPNQAVESGAQLITITAAEEDATENS